MGVRFICCVGRFLPERLKIAHIALALKKTVCGDCELANTVRFTGKELNPDCEQCRRCVRQAYKDLFGKDCKSV